MGIENYVSAVVESLDSMDQNVTDHSCCHDFAWEYLSEPTLITSKVLRPDIDSLMIFKNMPFDSYCNNHISHFIGLISIGYISDNKSITTENIMEILNYFVSRTQSQEIFTMEVAYAIDELSDSKGVAVIIDAEHLFASSFSEKTHNAHLNTRCFLKNFKTDSKLRSEFLAAMCHA